MKEYMLIFRNPVNQMDEPPSPEQMQATVSQWQKWIKGIAAQGNYMGTNRLTSEGATLHAKNLVKDGPYAEGKEVVGGYLIVKAGSLDAAKEMAKSCPIFHLGGNVEVRSVMAIDNDVDSKTFLASLQ